MDEEKQQKELLARISELENEVHTLEHDLIHDSLTGLKTRGFFEEESNTYLALIAHASGGKRREWFGFNNFSVLFFDIDFFKKINDTYGHATGDVVLREVAQNISKGMRVGDTVARWGGEEMVAMLLGSNEADAKNKAEDIRKAIEALTFESAPDLHVTISTGVASANVGMTCEELVKNADKALYQAKETGRNKVVAFTETSKSD